MAKLSSNLPWSLANSRWSSELNPVISNPLLQGGMLTGIKLIANTPQAINHLLQRQPLGWFTLDNTEDSVIWRTAWNTNTITLEASATTTVAIWVF